LGEPGVDKRVILKRILRKMDVNWIHLSQDGFHWLSQRTFGFHKRRGIFWPA